MLYYYSKRKKLLLVILGMILLLGIIRILFSLNENRMFLSMNFCNSYEEVMQGASETADLDIAKALLFNGCTAPYAAALNTFYISQDTSVDNWGGVF